MLEELRRDPTIAPLLPRWLRDVVQWPVEGSDAAPAAATAEGGGLAAPAPGSGALAESRLGQGAAPRPSRTAATHGKAGALPSGEKRRAHGLGIRVPVGLARRRLRAQRRLRAAAMGSVTDEQRLWDLLQEYGPECAENLYGVMTSSALYTPPPWGDRGAQGGKGAREEEEGSKGTERQPPAPVPARGGHRPVTRPPGPEHSVTATTARSVRPRTHAGGRREGRVEDEATPRKEGPALSAADPWCSPADQLGLSGTQHGQWSPASQLSPTGERPSAAATPAAARRGVSGPLTPKFRLGGTAPERSRPQSPLVQAEPSPRDWPPVLSQPPAWRRRRGSKQALPPLGDWRTGTRRPVTQGSARVPRWYRAPPSAHWSPPPSTPPSPAVTPYSPGGDRDEGDEGDDDGPDWLRAHPDDLAAALAVTSQWDAGVVEGGGLAGAVEALLRTRSRHALASSPLQPGVAEVPAGDPPPRQRSARPTRDTVTLGLHSSMSGLTSPGPRESAPTAHRAATAAVPGRGRKESAQSRSQGSVSYQPMPSTACGGGLHFSSSWRVETCDAGGAASRSRTAHGGRIAGPARVLRRPQTQGAPLQAPPIPRSRAGVRSRRLSARATAGDMEVETAQRWRGAGRGRVQERVEALAQGTGEHAAYRPSHLTPRHVRGATRSHECVVLPGGHASRTGAGAWRLGYEQLSAHAEAVRLRSAARRREEATLRAANAEARRV